MIKSLLYLFYIVKVNIYLKFFLFIILILINYDYNVISKYFKTEIDKIVYFPKWQKNMLNVYTIKNSIDKVQSKTCLICLKKIKKNHKIRKINCDCNQFYHQKCLIKWFECKCSCPICRKVLYEKINYL